MLSLLRCVAPCWPPAACQLLPSLAGSSSAWSAPAPLPWLSTAWLTSGLTGPIHAPRRVPFLPACSRTDSSRIFVLLSSAIFVLGAANSTGWLCISLRWRLPSSCSIPIPSVYPLVASGARLRAGHCACCGMDRRTRIRSTCAFSSLTAAVTFWVGGFDVLYACQDLDFDRSHRPELGTLRHFGIHRALLLARTSLHILMLGLLLALVVRLWPGKNRHSRCARRLLCCLLYEHSLVSAPAISAKFNAAFFTMNGVISLVFFIFIAADISPTGLTPELSNHCSRIWERIHWPDGAESSKRILP